MTDKTCRICGETKPIDQFHTRPGSRDGYRNDCRQCGSARHKASYQAHAESVRQRVALYRAEHPEEVKAYRQRHYAENTDRVKARVKAYREANRQQVLVKKAEWWQAHAEELRQRKRERWAANREEMTAKQRERYRRDPSAWLAGEARRRLRLSQAPTERFGRREIYDRDAGICQLCAEPVAFEAMTIDHIIPLARGGSHTRANVQVAHRRCNQQKWAHLPVLSPSPIG